MVGLTELNAEIAKRKKEIVINGFLDLRRTDIKSLPDNLTVNGHLYLTDSSVNALPRSLTVNGDLYLSRTRIRFLPDSLSVRGSLNISGTNIIELPDTLTVGGRVYGLEENLERLNQKKTDNEKKTSDLLRECQKEIKEGWKIFYGDYLTEKEKYPPLGEKRISLGKMIEKFAIQTRAFASEKYPLVASAPQEVFWNFVFGAIGETRSVPDTDLVEARHEISGKTAVGTCDGERTDQP